MGSPAGIKFWKAAVARQSTLQLSCVKRSSVRHKNNWPDLNLDRASLRNWTYNSILSSASQNAKKIKQRDHRNWYTEQPQGNTFHVISLLVATGLQNRCFACRCPRVKRNSSSTRSLAIGSCARKI